jgi:F-type H+-transporting ATPase subunit b
MPQLNPVDWGPQLIWLVITFSILYALMRWVALPRIGGLIETREKHIGHDLATAERLRRVTDEAIVAYEQALAEAKQRAHRIADEARNTLNEELAAERARLEGDLAKKAAEADARIEAAKNSALKDVNSVAAEVAADIVRRLIGVTPSAPEIAKAVTTARET